MTGRLERVAGQLAERNLDAILISAPENRRYLSGFTGSSGYLLITPSRAMLFTDSRYSEQAANQAPDFQVIQVRGGWGWLVDQLKETGVQRVGFESRHMTVANYEKMLDALKEDGNLGKVSLVAASGIAEEHRVFKDSEEMAFLQKAIDASDSAMEAVCPTIQEGMTEKEVAWRMEMAMREFGADGISSETIVSAGPNGAMAHPMPSARPKKAGEARGIGVGAVADGDWEENHRPGVGRRGALVPYSRGERNRLGGVRALKPFVPAPILGGPCRVPILFSFWPIKCAGTRLARTATRTCAPRTWTRW